MAMTENSRHKEQIEELRARIAVRGLFINIIGPLVLFGLGYSLRLVGLTSATPSLDSNLQTIITYGLGGLALLDLVFGMLLVKSSLKPQQLRAYGIAFQSFADRVVQVTTVSFAIGAFAIVYGFVLYLLGATIETFVFFLLVSLVAFRLLRPSHDRLESLWQQVSA